MLQREPAWSSEVGWHGGRYVRMSVFRDSLAKDYIGRRMALQRVTLWHGALGCGAQVLSSQELDDSARESADMRMMSQVTIDALEGLNPSQKAFTLLQPDYAFILTLLG